MIDALPLHGHVRVALVQQHRPSHRMESAGALARPPTVMDSASPHEQMAPSPYTILAVDGQAETRAETKRLLEREGHTVLCASTGGDALSLLADKSVQVVLVERVLPDMTGTKLVEHIRDTDDLVQIILQNSHAGAYPSRELLRALAIQGYHDSSDGPEKLLHCVDIACRTHTVLERSRRSENLKAQLVANVSHELRTPLNVILGFIELMREGTCGAQPPEATEALTTIHRQALILLHLINDFLDLSKLQAGAVHLGCEPVSVSMIVDEFRDTLPVLLGDAPVSPRWDISPDAYAIADGSKVRIIVQNLISNAAKYTVQGEIAIRVRTNGAQAYVTVSDTGPGIEPENLERIFGLFEQVEAPGSCRQGGTGIGLYLARTFSRLMGGDITVESTPGIGSTFTLRLPAAH